MRPGDAIYIPALTFHSGGSADAPSEESLMLSVAFEWPRTAARKDKEAHDVTYKNES